MGANLPPSRRLVMSADILVVTTGVHAIGIWVEARDAGCTMHRIASPYTQQRIILPLMSRVPRLRNPNRLFCGWE